MVTREESESLTNELFRLMIEDKFTTRIHETYPLEEVARAHQVSELHFVLGKRLAGGLINVGELGYREPENHGEIAFEAVETSTRQKHQKIRKVNSWLYALVVTGGLYE